MRKRVMMAAAALLVVGGSPLLMASRASADPVQTQAAVYRCHATVTVDRGFIVGTTSTQSATGYGLCLLDGGTSGLYHSIELSGAFQREGVSPGPADTCPPSRFSFDTVRIDYWNVITQEWREITGENSSAPSPQVIGVFANSASSVPQGFGIAQTDLKGCGGEADGFPGFTTTVDWTFPIGYPFSGPPPGGILGLCVTEYRLVPIPQTCIDI